GLHPVPSQPVSLHDLGSPGAQPHRCLPRRGQPRGVLSPDGPARWPAQP
ncbi:unnamed protein product, partial [Gulo gulo]